MLNEITAALARLLLYKGPHMYIDMYSDTCIMNQSACAGMFSDEYFSFREFVFQR
jgi:hypothetical protein